MNLAKLKSKFQSATKRLDFMEVLHGRLMYNSTYAHVSAGVVDMLNFGLEFQISRMITDNLSDPIENSFRT